MAGHRNNHYVPRWHQTGFLNPGYDRLAYLDLDPPRHQLPDGGVAPGRARSWSAPSQCFVQRDLYSTFFGTAVNDEIERMLFGPFDRMGAQAVRAFIGPDPAGWHDHFQSLFAYLDIQKLRTPKGLDWLRGQYPGLTQNELMREMQGLQLLNTTIWVEGVREIVSAEDSKVKFLLSDHPVTSFNSGRAPSDAACAYPNDPSIALKGTQTLFPLNRDFCLILTNLEYARDADCDPLQKRTFARNFRPSLTRTDALIRSRRLTADQVLHVNAALKARARRYIAAGEEAWLHPDAGSPPRWNEIAVTLRPPENELWGFGGEIIGRMKSGETFYQDEFGRREPEHQKMFLIEPTRPKLGEPCGCGSARAFRECCEPIPEQLRPSWAEVSIRERNLGLYRAVVDIFELREDKTWEEVRREVTDARIRKIYEVFAAMWPLETDLLALLPKPDGRARAVYTGVLHPDVILECAAGACLYFGELIVEHPFVHARALNKDYSPIDNPQSYRGEVLKAVSLFLSLMPLVEASLVTLIPDPGAFDFHLREQTMRMAQDRYAGVKPDPPKNDRSRKLAEEDTRRAILHMPRRALEHQMRKAFPDLSEAERTAAFEGLEQLKRQDPLGVLQTEPLPDHGASGQLTMMKLAPNFEMAMFLAQATGACIVTDSHQRFTELVATLLQRQTAPISGAPDLAREIASIPLTFPRNPSVVLEARAAGKFAVFPTLFAELARYLRQLPVRGRKPNYEGQLAGRFARARAASESYLRRAEATTKVRMRPLLPEHGLQNHTINRLLLMSSSEHHLSATPMAFYLEPLEGDSSVA